MKKSGSAMARVRGLGSAKEGVGHWISQRLTALAMIPLMLWFVASMIALVGADHATVVGWFAAPANAVLSTLLLAAMFYHMTLGLQVVIEDYVQHEGVRIAALIGVRFAAILLAAATIFSILRMAFTG